MAKTGMAKGFRGTYSVMITPFDGQGALDLPALRRFVDWQISKGIHGLIALGSTGEFLSLSDGEHEAVTETVIRQAAGRVPVLIGTGAEDTREAVRLSRRAERMGADGVMIIPPFYSTPTDDELYHHYKTISDAIGLPIMLYNNPATANVDMTPPIVARLSTIGNCRYIKDFDVRRDARARHSVPVRRADGRLRWHTRFRIFFVEGAAGWVAVASNVAPAPLARLFELVADEARITEAHAGTCVTCRLSAS